MMENTASRDDEYLRRFVPSRPLCVAAFDYAQTQLPLTLLHHSLRVFIFAKWLAEREDDVWGTQDATADLLFVASICHDLGATHHHDGELRFEVEGANAAKEFALSQGVEEKSAHLIWIAVAVHTSPQIAERIHPLSRLVRLGVMIDFRQATRDELGANEYAGSIESQIPRLEIEKILGDAVVKQALPKRHKAPAASWPGVLVRAHLENPDWNGVNRGF
jgi:HD domain